MSASFYDLMKYAKTGIASADMTDYDKLRVLTAFGGYPISTVSGVPPLSFRANGTPLISWSMLGNGQQTGTPTPDNSIQPEFVGVRTANLFDTSTVTLGKYINAQGVEVRSTAQTPIIMLNHTDYIEIQPNTNYIYHYKFRYGVGNTIALCWFDASKNLISRNTKNIYEQDKEYTITGTSPANAAFCIINFAGYIPNGSMELSFNSGTTALPYEPYGYKIHITCTGQTVPVYLGQTQTVRRIKKLVLTGTENWFINESVSTEDTAYFFTTIIASNTYVAGYAICSHFKYKDAYRILDENGFHLLSGYGGLRFRIMRTIAGTFADFKTYLSQQYAAGTPVTVWYVLATPETAIVNEPLAKIGDYADELRSSDAAITIPTVKGSNTLTVDTELQPSEVSITGHIKAS